MLTLIHGDDTTASRNYYFDLKSESHEGTTFADAEITVTDLQQALSGSDLFGSAKQIFIENLLVKKKLSKELDSLVSLIQSSVANNSSSITLWESKELTAKQASLFKGATIKQFKIPSTVFAFLDALKPSNGKQLIELFHKTLADKDPEFILVMLQRQVRLLLALQPSVILGSEATPESDSGQARMTISELSRLAPWQRRKLEKQTSLFTTQQLLQLHNNLFQLELNMKTGQLSQPLESEIDFLLVNL